MRKTKIHLLPQEKLAVLLQALVNRGSGVENVRPVELNTAAAILPREIRPEITQYQQFIHWLPKVEAQYIAFLNQVISFNLAEAKEMRMACGQTFEEVSAVATEVGGETVWSKSTSSPATAEVITPTASKYKSRKYSSHAKN